MTTKTISVGSTQRLLTGLHADDTYFNEIGNAACWELIEICRTMAPADARIWDIGANIGVTAMAMASASPDCRIVAVEAGDRNFETLRQNVDQNELSAQIKTLHAAASDADGEVSFLDMSAYGYITAKNEGHRVRAVGPQTLFAESGFDRLDFMKIDIEGFEEPFMKAAYPIFQRDSTVIQTEFNGWCQLWNARRSPVEFMEWISANFEDVYLLGRGVFAGRKIERNDLFQTLHDVMVEMNTVCDLLICAEPGRIRLPAID